VKRATTVRGFMQSAYHILGSWGEMAGIFSRLARSPGRVRVLTYARSTLRPGRHPGFRPIHRKSLRPGKDLAQRTRKSSMPLDLSYLTITIRNEVT
jgi:hypothetical protein